MKYYVFQDIEKKWIEYWDKNRTYEFVDSKNADKRMYILDMFPFPSGSGLHVGHLKGYLATDILTRFYTMQGYLVLHPMGWDSFGLPSEQYAISTGNMPGDFTRENIDAFRSQLKRLMLSYDFSREINTSDPNYYKITQQIFSKMYEANLAERRETVVNWCPELNTVLSDEEIVMKDGKCYSERGMHPVENRVQKQWMLKITDYAEELLEGLEDLPWPNNIKKLQKDWIGKEKKYVYKFQIKVNNQNKEYPLYLKYASSIRRLKGIGIHQFSALSKELNLNKQLYGNGHKLDIKLHNQSNYEQVDVFYLWDMDFRSDELIPLFDGNEEDFYDAEIEKYYLRKYKLSETIQYKMKDWVFSRQRYWGEPIPILYDDSGNVYLDKDLPVLLPTSVDYKSSRDGSSPLANNKAWMEIAKNGKRYTRESDTMPNWAGSSWYFLAYLLKNPDGTYLDLFSSEAKKVLDRWIPVDIYVGGQEHATLHLLYARFWHKFLHNLGVVSSPEPFKLLFNQGMVLGSDGQKMSKSKGNCVNINEIVDKYGADALRVYEAFSGPTQLSFNWDDRGVKSSQQWLNKVYIFFQTLDEIEEMSVFDEEVCQIENQLIKNISTAIPALKVNVGVSELMIFMNGLNKIKKYHKKALRTFVQILSLYAPAMAEELWTENLNEKIPLFKSTWPSLNEENENTPKEFRVFYDGKYKFSMHLSDSDVSNVEDIKKEISYRLNLVNSEITIISSRKVILARSI